MLTPLALRVMSRIRCLNRSSDFGAIVRLMSGPAVKLNPRNFTAPHVRARAAQDTGGPESRGSGAIAEGRPWTEVQGRAERRLRGGSAGLRGGGAEGVGRRFRAPAAADRAG